MKFTKRGLQISQSGSRRNLAKVEPPKKREVPTRPQPAMDKGKRKRSPRMAVLPDGTQMSYAEYITSPHWRGRHAEFLKRGKYRCSFMPFLKIGKGKRYACHHKDYDYLGQEIYGVNVRILHPWVHMWVVHGILSGFKSAGKQKTPYPNRSQKAFHFFCDLPDFLKLPFWLVTLGTIAAIPTLLIAWVNPDIGLAIVVGLAGFSLLQARRK